MKQTSSSKAEVKTDLQSRLIECFGTFSFFVFCFGLTVAIANAFIDIAAKSTTSQNPFVPVVEPFYRWLFATSKWMQGTKSSLCDENVSDIDHVIQFALPMYSLWGFAFICLIGDVIGDLVNIRKSLKHTQWYPPSVQEARRFNNHPQYRLATFLALINTFVAFVFHLLVINPFIVTPLRGDVMCSLKEGADPLEVRYTPVNTFEPYTLVSESNYFSFLVPPVEAQTVFFGLLAKCDSLYAFGYGLFMTLVIGLIADVVFWSLHMLAHEIKIVYDLVHRVHHIFVDTVGIACIAAHPVEHILVNLPTVLTPPILLGLPFHWSTMWLAFAGMKTVAGHSGYKLGKPWTRGRHDVHHHVLTCEYGNDLFCDKLFGTTFEKRYPHMVPGSEAALKFQQSSSMKDSSLRQSNSVPVCDVEDLIPMDVLDTPSAAASGRKATTPARRGGSTPRRGGRSRTPARKK